MDSSSIRNDLRRLTNTIRRLEQQDSALSGKIERLRTAQSSVSAIHEDDKSFVSWVDTYDVGRKWLGTRREEFESQKRDAKSAGDTYCNQVQEIHQTITNTINALEAQRQDIFWQKLATNTGISSLNVALSAACLLEGN